MKRALLLTFWLMLCASLVLAQAGAISVFADLNGTSCDLDNSGGFMEVHCLHVYSPGGTACQFALQIIGTPLSWIGDSSPFPSVIGNTQEGISVAYGMCRLSPVHVVTASYMGVSQICDKIQVVDDPTAVPPGIYVTDCILPVPNLLPATGGYAIINPDQNCACDYPILAEETSWGLIKSLYR